MKGLWYDCDVRTKAPLPTGSKPHRNQKLVTNGFVWGRLRVDAGLSLTNLSELTGINVGTLSHYENGRMVPTADDFDAVWNALRDQTPT